MTDSKQYPTRAIVALALLTTIARGLFVPLYSYGISNQTNQLPLIKHTINPTYLSTDWTVMVRTEPGSPRFVYTQTIAAISQVAGLPATVFCIYALSSAVGLWGLYKLLNHLFEDRLVSILTVGTVIIPFYNSITLLNYPDLGGNSLFSTYLIPSHLANALILLGFVFMIRRQYCYGFAILGVATLFHIVNGFWMSVVAGVYVVIIELSPWIRSLGFREAITNVPWMAGGIYGLITFIGVSPILFENLRNPTGFYPIYLMAWVRHPHHYVPSTWSLFELIITSLFTIIATLLLWNFRENIFDSTDSMVFTFTWIGTLSLILIGGGVFAELYAIPVIIKLQPFHVDDFLFVILFGGLWKFGIQLSRHVLVEVVESPSTFLSQATAILLCITLVIAPIMGVDFTLFNQPDNDSDLSETYEWISTETPEDATFIANPRLHDFRLETSRAMVVNIKSFPFRPIAMIEWGKRIKNICDTQQKLTNSDLAECANKYQSLDEKEIRKNAAKYEVCWVLSKNPTYSFEKRFSNSDYTVYYLQNSTHCQQDQLPPPP